MSNQSAPDEIQKKVPQHFVCTHEQARKFIDQYNEYYIAVCGCRQSRGLQPLSHGHLPDVQRRGHYRDRKRPATKAEPCGLWPTLTKRLVSRLPET